GAAAARAGEPLARLVAGSLPPGAGRQRRGKPEQYPWRMARAGRSRAAQPGAALRPQRPPAADLRRPGRPRGLQGHRAAPAGGDAPMIKRPLAAAALLLAAPLSLAFQAAG